MEPVCSNSTLIDRLIQTMPDQQWEYRIHLDTGEIVLWDFTFREAEQEHLESLLALDLETFLENHPGSEAGRVEEVYRRLRKELAEVREERDILPKALAVFSRHSR